MGRRAWRSRASRGFEAKPTWMIACEDGKSAPAYLSRLFAVHGHVAYIPVRRRINRTDPVSIIERIALVLGDIRAHKDDDPDRIWAIIDAEPHLGPDRQKAIDAAIQRARELRVTVLVANPCFEYWLHLHIAEPGREFDDPKSMQTALCAAWKADKQPGTYTKGRADLGRLVTRERIASAAGLARKKHQHGPRIGQPPHLCDPCCTDLYKLIDALEAPDRK